MASLLSLPFEIREKIYREILPFTISKPNRINNTSVWRLGDTALLATCRRIYEERMSFMNGENVFTLAVESARTVFITSYVSRHDKMPQRLVYDFYEYLRVALYLE